MDIIKHFEITNENNFIIYTLKDNEWDNFLNKLPNKVRGCFISDKKLDVLSNELNKTKEEIIKERIPINNKSVQAGDFGEILAYFLFKEKYLNINGPKKWRWKNDPEKSGTGSDVILYSVNINKPTKEDLLISIESKTQATSCGKHQIQEAIIGAANDLGHKVKKDKKTYNINRWKESKISRIAQTLSWLKIKYEDELEKNSTKEEKEKIKNEISIFNRFINAIEPRFGPYTKKAKAIAFIDSNFLKDEIKKPIIVPTNIGIDLEIYVIGIKDLKKMYEDVYSKILKIC